MYPAMVRPQEWADLLQKIQNAEAVEGQLTKTLEEAQAKLTAQRQLTLDFRRETNIGVAP
jgi:hypothetical protein